MGDLTLCEAHTGGALDRLNWQHSRELDQNFSKKSNVPGLPQGEMSGCGIDRYITSAEIGLERYFKEQILWRRL